MHNPYCDMGWEGGRFSANVAADGGAMYLTEVTTRNISGSANYDNNKVREVWFWSHRGAITLNGLEARQQRTGLSRPG